MFPGKTKTSLSGPVNVFVFCSFHAQTSVSQVFFSTASRCSDSSVSALPPQLTWIPPRSTTCAPSGPPSCCLLVSIGHHTSGGGPPDAPAGSSTGNVLSRSTSSTTMSSRMVSAYSGQAGGDQETPSPDRSHTRRLSTPALPVPPRPPQPPQPLHSLKTSTAAARHNAAKSRSTPSCATFPRRVGPVEDTTAVEHTPDERPSQQSLAGRHRRNEDVERFEPRGDRSMLEGMVRENRRKGSGQRRRPGMFDGINLNTPYRWKRSAPRAAPLGRKTSISPANTTRLSEHILRVSDVLCLGTVTIHSLVLEWLDAEGLDVRPGDTRSPPRA